MIRSIMTLRLALAGLLLVVAAFPAEAGAVIPEPEKYAIESASAELSSSQAGAHANLTTSFAFTQQGGEGFALTRDVIVKLPPGVTGNPQGVPQCSSLEFGSIPAASECPIDSQVGVAEVTLGGAVAGTFTEPIYNMERPVGGDIVARLGFFAQIYPVTVDITVDPRDYGLVATVEGASAAAELLSASTTLWGVPAEEANDIFRITPLEALEHNAPSEGRSSNLSEAPFMTNPTSCGLPGEMSVTAISYQLPGEPSTKSAPMPQMIGCQKVKFFPSFSIRATNPEAAAPSGIEAELQMAQDETPHGRGTSTLKEATVALPLGFSINPAAGDGLAACSPQQVHVEEARSAECPPSSKIGSAEIVVPALERALHADIYQRTPEPGRLFGFWLVSDELGVHLKLPSAIAANLLTGQLITEFSGLPSLGGNPQIPFSDLKLHFFSGPRAPIATPNACGTYQAHYEFRPWSGNPATVGDAPMQISTGCGKGGFNPALHAGTVASFAGAFSPFLFELTRQDGEANPKSIDVTLPQGLLAKLAGVPLCPEVDAAAASCPEGSKIGSIAAAAGVGGAPLWIPQPGKAPTAAYLAGPYLGAPYSIIAKVPAQAGPFDLGTVVTRSGIYVDPETATATIKTDPLPQILEGVPIAYRAIRVFVDRPDFTLNPTDCSAKSIRATVLAAGGEQATPSVAFQASNCAKLDYSPKLRMQLQGATGRSGNPSLRAVLTQPGGQANTASTTVILPSSEFIDQSHINNPCTRVQFAADACPPRSILGTARAVTPLLDQALEGPVYFRSNGGERELPDVVADLRGPFRVILVGFVDSVHRKGSEISRVRTRFANVPDAPVTRFTIDLYGGKRGLIENSADLCARRRYATVKMLAQNGKHRDIASPLRVNCP
jgi:hypothetical protein